MPNRVELHSPTLLGALRLRNRIVMAPMSRRRAGAGRVPTPLTAAYYAQRASAGLIVAEATNVSPQGVGYPGTIGIYTPEQIAAWKQVTDAVHAADGKIFLQLWHVGRISHSSFHDGAPPVSASAVRAYGNAITEAGLLPFETPRALDPEEIPGVIAQFREAARNALDARFDGVEIHGASGYRVDQFLRDSTNRRTDAYGGPVENRARLLLEVTDAAIGVWGAGRVAVRVAPYGRFNDISDSDTPGTFTYVARQLAERPLAYLHVIRPEASDQAPESAGELIREMRAAYGGTFLLAGGFGLTEAEQAVARGEADLVAFGKPFISNPDLVRRFRLGAPLAQPDPATFLGGGAAGYTDYPELP